MQISYRIRLSLLLSAMLAGCRKEYSCENCKLKPNLLGTWKLVEFNVSVSSTTTYLAADGPWSSFAEYRTVTTKNAGIYNFHEDYIAVTGLSSESVPVPVTFTIQRNGVRTIGQDGQFGWFIYPHDLSLKYQLIGTDSLYFPENGLLFMPDPHAWTIMNSHPSGGKFSIDGTTLLIQTVVSRDSTFLDNGIYHNVSQNDSGYIKLERQ